MDMKEQIGWKRPNGETAKVDDVTISFGDKEIGRLQPITIRESFGTGVLNSSGTAIMRDTFGGTETFSVDNGKLRSGQRHLRLERDTAIMRNVSVYRNGLNLKEGHDFIVNDNGIELNSGVQAKDDDIEIRYEYFHGELMENVLLLPSALIPEDQLEQYMPDHGDIFTVDKLISNNPLLVPYTGYKGRCVKAVVTQFGILGNLQLYKEDTI